MRAVPGYETNHGYATVEYMIWIMIQLNPTRVPYIMFFILKCTTIRLGLSVGVWGTTNHGKDPMQYSSFCAIVAIESVSLKLASTVVKTVCLLGVSTQELTASQMTRDIA